MKLNIKIIATVVAVCAVGAGAYLLGKQQSAATPTAALPAAPAPAPASHAQPEPNARFTHFRVGNRNVKSILADGERMWVGTSGGVVRYDLADDAYKLFDTSNGLLSNGVFFVGKLRDQIAVGTYGGGLSLLDPASGQWQNYNVPQGLADAFVYQVLEAQNGDVWIATWSGANRIRGGKLDDRSQWDTYTVANTGGGLPNDWVYALAEAADGSIWLGTEGGLAQFKGGQWQHWTHKEGLGADYESVKNDITFTNDPGRASSHHARQKTEQGLENVDVAYNPNYIISMALTPDGSVWCGTWGGGLAQLKDGQWTNHTVRNGLPSNHIFMLHSDSTGRLWVGTSGGLARRETDGSFKVFTMEHGLYSNNVFSMAVASDGSHWVGSYGGVARIVELP